MGAEEQERETERIFVAEVEFSTWPGLESRVEEILM